MTESFLQRMVGAWVLRKYRRQAKACGVRHTALQMRKRGFPVSITVEVLARQ
jgi:hypothetical protein